MNMVVVQDTVTSEESKNRFRLFPATKIAW